MLSQAFRSQKALVIRSERYESSGVDIGIMWVRFRGPLTRAGQQRWGLRLELVSHSDAGFPRR